MAKTAGRDMTVSIGGTPIAGGRVHTISRNMTAIDASTATDAEFLSYLADVFSTDELVITVSGLEDGTVLRDLAMTTDPADRHLSNLTFEFPGTPADSISGDFIVTSVEFSGDFREATTFDVTFTRTGQHTFTQGV